MSYSFSLAKEAIKLDDNCADAYQSAANVCMSLSRYEDAIEYYPKAVKCDPNNGNRYFSLGYAQGTLMPNSANYSIFVRKVVNKVKKGAKYFSYEEISTITQLSIEEIKALHNS